MDRQLSGRNISHTRWVPPDGPTTIAPPSPILMPQLPDPDFNKFGHGISLLGGKNLPDRPNQHQAPVGFGRHDDADVFRERGALPDLCAAASAVDVGCTLRVYPGYHTWQFAARAFSDAFGWIAQRVHTPA